MPNIIPARRQKSFGEAILGGLAEGLPDAVKQYQGQKLAQQNMQSKMKHEMEFEEMKQRLQAERAMELEQKKQGLIGNRTKELEGMRQKGRQDLLGQKQELLNEIFGQKPGQDQQVQKSGQFQAQQQPSYDPLKISDADIARASSMDPNLGRELRAARDTALREQRSERDFQERQKEKSPEFQREQQIAKEQAQADVKYNKELQEASKQHELKEKTLVNLEKLNKKGVTGKPWEKLAEKFGLVNVTSEGRREFAAEVKNLITDIRSILGSQFTGFEFQTILNAYPSADFSKGANEAIIKNLKEFQDIKKKEVQFANEMKKENGGKVPQDFQSKVNEKVHEYAATKLENIRENTKKIMYEEYGIPEGHTLLLAPDGEPLSVPNDKVEENINRGAMML